MPPAGNFSAARHIANTCILAPGSICTFIDFASVYPKSGFIWMASFVHAVFNNASRPLSYLAGLDRQLAANRGLAAVLVLAVLALYLRREWAVFEAFFSGRG